MRGVRVDDKLLADAESNYDATISDLEDRAQAYADQFHSSVIVPFCDRHNLRFFSGMGVFFFEAPGGKNFDDPEAELRNWGMAKGVAELSAHPTQFETSRWVLACDDDELPYFLRTFAEIYRLLNLDFMGGDLGYWVNDYVPATFPRQPNVAT
jgi:hypothetical protein